MKSVLRNIVKNIMDSYISFECRILRIFLKKNNAGKKKVLLFKKDAIGDYIVSIPALAHYREFYKDAEITFVVNSIALGLSPQFSFIDHIYTYDASTFRTNFFSRRRFFLDLVRAQFDIAIYMSYTREPIGDRIIAATGAPVKIGFVSEKGPMSTDTIYTELVSSPKELTEPERNMFLVSHISGKTSELKLPSFDIALFAHDTADTLLQSHQLEPKSFVVLLAGAGASYRTWQLEKFAEVADYIIEKYKIKVVLSGSKADIPLSAKIYGLAKNKGQIIDLTGQTDIQNFAHILHRALFYFGSETGPMHLAIAVGTPVVTILGGGSYGRFFPYGNRDTNRLVDDSTVTNCRGDGWKCSEHLMPGEIAPCIRNITVESATHEIDSLLHTLSQHDKSR